MEKYKYIESKEGVNPNTYKMFINIITFCDITYMPKIIYNNIETIIINKYRIPTFYFILIDQFKVITYPLTSFWRLEKVSRDHNYYLNNINLNILLKKNLRIIYLI